MIDAAAQWLWVPFIAGLFAWMVFLARKIGKLRRSQTRPSSGRLEALQTGQRDIPDRTARLEGELLSVRRQLEQVTSRLYALQPSATPEVKTSPGSRPASEFSERPSHSANTPEPGGPESAPNEPGPEAPFLAELVKSFNELAANYQQEEDEAFQSRFKPQSAKLVGERYEGNEEGKLWLIPIPEVDGLGVILPSSEVVRNWEKLYRHMSGLEARRVLGSTYSFSEGRTPAIASPAICERAVDQEGYVLSKSGQMQGV